MNPFLWSCISLTAIFAIPLIIGLIIAIWGIRKSKKTGK
mgnify:FL=1